MTGAAATATTNCWRCASSTAGALVCDRCGAPQPLGGEVDLFAVLGLPRRLGIDAEELERRFHEASRAVHPDRHQTAGTRARELSLAASAAVNRAHRTLRDPVARGRYWLELHGMRLGEANNQVPPALATLVFETQEKLADLRTADGDGEAHGEVRDILAALTAQLGALREGLLASYADWDRAGASAPAVLADLKRRLSEIAYLRTLAGDVEGALGG